MKKQVNDFVINIATVNGSGSQSANSILLKTLFRMGIPVGGKNVFPSNIAGLPTWFWIRANLHGFVGRRKEADIVVAMNPQTVIEDTKTLKVGGIFIYNSDMPVKLDGQRTDITYIPVPFKKLVDQATDQMKIKKMLINIVYVGVLAELLKLDQDSLSSALKSQLGSKQSVLESNLKAMQLGIQFAQESLKDIIFPYCSEKMNANQNKIIMDGNTAGALGLVYGGAQFAAWYPITPSSSIMEGFIKYANQLRKDENGKNTFGVVQAEDELASICMVLGAGWAGARAITATSGPGISLMAEAAGYAYYTEIPSVIWDVQRVGPSTGMPTRTAQGDITSALYLSHGDTKHPLLIPGNIGECFEFGQTCFDLAERLQTLVFVLTDLDLGMNLWMDDEFKFPTKPMDRGKVLTEKELATMTQFHRYADPDNDGIPYRTLPGTQHELAAYFNRGSGHNSKAGYTEKADEYQEIMDRLSKKWETAKTLVPRPIIDSKNSKIGIIAYGTSDAPMAEARHILSNKNIQTDYLRLRAIPFTDSVVKFIEQHERVYVIDQNRDAQMFGLLQHEYPHLHTKLQSITHYDGTPITAEHIFEPIQMKEGV